MEQGGTCMRMVVCECVCESVSVYFCVAMSVNVSVSEYG